MNDSAFKHDDDDWGCSDSDGSVGEDSQMSGMVMLRDNDAQSTSSFGSVGGVSKKSKKKRRQQTA
jgi:hypothetical protein